MTTAHGQTKFWTAGGGGGSALSTAGNWNTTCGGGGSTGVPVSQPAVFQKSCTTGGVDILASLGLSSNPTWSNITFNSPLNASNTVTLGSSSSTSPTLHLPASWFITNNCASGTVTFAPFTSGSAAMSLDISGTGTITVAAGGTIAITAALDGSGGFVKSGAGTLTLATGNTYAGKTSIDAGTITGSGESMFGANPASFTSNQITFNGGTLQASGGINFSSNRGITISSGGGTFNNTSANLITLTNVTTGSGPITKTGNGTLLLAGAHTFTGLMTVSSGTVQLNATGTYPDASALSISSGAVFDMKGVPETIGSLAGAGTVTSIAAGNITLTAGGDNTTTTFSGVIQNGTATSLGFTKAGTGAMTLSGTNTCTGATTINAGTLFVNGSTAASSAVSVASAGTLAGSGTAAGTVSLSGTVSPGGTASTTAKLSTGAFTFNTASSYNFEVSNVAGTAGVSSGWDLVNSTGALTVNSTSASPAVIKLVSIGSTGFNSCTSYTWTLAQGTSVSGFAANKFSINTSSFAPAFSGTFSVQSTATAINLVYTAPGNNTINLTSTAGTSAQTVCINTAITTITYTTTGATGATFSGLPSGVTGSFTTNTVTISGTPTVANNFTYTVTLTGGCGNITTNGTINVKANNTIALTSGVGTNNQTKCINTAITVITYTTTGATGATVSGLPTGITGSFTTNTVTINGTPTASGTFTYTVTLTGGCGNTTATGTLTVKSVTINAISDQSVCGGKPVAAINFSSTPAGASFAWINNNTSIGLAGAGSGDISSYISPIVSSAQTGTITVIAALNGCNAPSATFSITINGSLPASTWTGAVSNDWFDPDNWTNCVCGATTSATIAATANDPVMNATGEANNLTLNSGATLTLQASNTLNIYGDLSNGGTISADFGSTIFLGGSVPQSIGGSSAVSVYNLTLDNSSGATLSTPVGINGSLLLLNGTLTTNNNLTLVASQSGSSFTNGNIGPVSATADITGDVTIEQFAVRSGSTNWSFLGAPVDNTSGLTMSDWNDDFYITCSTCPGGSSVNGTTFTSIYSYDETGTGLYDDASKYVPVTSISDPIELSKGYWVYLGNGMGTAIKFNVTGSVAKANISTIDIPLTYTNHGSLPDDGWNLISNPLPCPISWAALLGGTSGIDDGIYVYNSSTGSYSQYVAGVSSPALGSGGIGDNIPMCQGFYVHSSGATALTASENIKIATANPDFLRVGDTQSTVQNYVPVPRLFLTNNTSGIKDETAFHFNTNASNAFDAKYDTYKLIGDYSLPYVAGMSSDGKMCSINGLQHQNTSLPIKAISPVTGSFTFSLGGDTVNGTCVILYDSYTSTTTNLTTAAYNCTLYDTTTTARFTLTFSSGALNATTTVTQPVCMAPQGFITAVGNNAGPWNYVWKDDNGLVVKTTLNKSSADTLTPLNGGNYTVEMSTAGQCDNYSETFSVNSIEIPSAQFTGSADTVDLALSGYVYFEPVTNGSNTWSWSFGDGSVSSQMNPTYNYSSTGTFTVQLTATSASGCEDTSYSTLVVINTTVGLHASNTSGDVTLVNTDKPVCTLLLGSRAGEEFSYSIIDMNGKEILHSPKLQATNGKLDIDLSDIASGIYLLILNPEKSAPLAFKLHRQ